MSTAEGNVGLGERGAVSCVLVRGGRYRREERALGWCRRPSGLGVAWKQHCRAQRSHPLSKN